MLLAVCTRAQVQRLKESRLTIRGDGDQDSVASGGGLDKALHIVPTVLLVRVQRFRNDLYKAVEPSTRPLVLSMIVGSYWRRRRRNTTSNYWPVTTARVAQLEERKAAVLEDPGSNPTNTQFFFFCFFL